MTIRRPIQRVWGAIVLVGLFILTGCGSGGFSATPTADPTVHALTATAQMQVQHALETRAMMACATPNNAQRTAWARTAFAPTVEAKTGTPSPTPTAAPPPSPPASTGTALR